MKALFKVLSILAVAVLVGGLLFGVVTAMSSGSSAQARPINGEFTRPDYSDSDGELQFPADSIKNLLIISVVSAVYLNYPKWAGRKKSIMTPSA